MIEPETANLENNNENSAVSRRRNLLPWWIKFFIWIFLIFGIAVLAGILFLIIGWDFQLSLYGLRTTTPGSFIGISILILFAFKAFISYSLWTEKGYAVKLAIVDAIMGCVICFLVMGIIPFIAEGDGLRFQFRLELLLLIPYWIKLDKIKNQWKEINGN